MRKLEACQSQLWSCFQPERGPGQPLCDLCKATLYRSAVRLLLVTSEHYYCRFGEPLPHAPGRWY
jgi:hypothetical protein